MIRMLNHLELLFQVDINFLFINLCIKHKRIEKKCQSHVLVAYWDVFNLALTYSLKPKNIKFNIIAD